MVNKSCFIGWFLLYIWKVPYIYNRMVLWKVKCALLNKMYYKPATAGRASALFPETKNKLRSWKMTGGSWAFTARCTCSVLSRNKFEGKQNYCFWCSQLGWAVLRTWNCWQSCPSMPEMRSIVKWEDGRLSCHYLGRPHFCMSVNYGSISTKKTHN